MNYNIFNILLSYDSSPYVRSVGHVFAYLYTLDDDLERPMEYETSLLRKGFPLQKYISAPSPL